MRPASSIEDRLLRALRQAGVINAEQARDVRDLLEASEECSRCVAVSGVVEPTCPRCQGTGEQLVIR
jgi:hypothetical protein